MAESTNENTLNISIGSTTTTEEAKPSVEEVKRKGPDKAGFYWGTGRRKSSVARVRLKPGKGEMQINNKKLEDYFPKKQDQQAVVSPLQTIKGEKSFDIFINLNGGGTTGQSGAARLGIARALVTFDSSFISSLRDEGHLTRDGRMVERKKPGQRGARRRFQFSKR